MFPQYSVVLYLLLRKYPHTINYRITNDCRISSVRIYNGGAIDKKIFYIIKNTTNLPALSNYRESAFLFCSSSIENEEVLNVCSNIAFINADVNEYTLLEDLFEILQNLYEWDSQLKDALLSSISLSDFFKLGEVFIPCPHTLIDRNFSIISCSKSYSKIFFKDFNMNIDAVGQEYSLQVPQAQVEDLLMDEEFHFIEKIKVPFIYPSWPNTEYFYCINFHKSGLFLARFIIHLPNGENALNQGEAALINHFGYYLEKIYHRYAGDELSRHQNDRMHNLLRSMFLETGDMKNVDINNILLTYGWKRTDEFSLIKLLFFEGGNWNSASSYICQQLEEETEDSCAVILDNSIVWVLNHTHSSTKNTPDSLFKSLAYTVREYTCKAGISDSFDDFYMVKNYLNQAQTAYEIGQYRDPHFWYYRFCDYIFDYLINQLTKDFHPLLVCHKGLLRLLDYDKEKNKDYVHTLYCYLLCDCNSTHTARKLYLHRTSFLRRLERIKKITQIDMADKDEMLHLRLSFKMLHIDARDEGVPHL